MKKIMLFAAVLLSASTMMAQTFVSTEPSNRNVILEEYTGINCGYCPDGHAKANQVVENNPGRAWAINIHQGGYANNTYTTEFGDALARQANINAYPAGTVNRHKFSGNSTNVDRGQFINRSNQILAMASPVNVAAHATIDYAANTLTVVVEGYYTANSELSTNQLNVAVLQNNVIGQQANYGNYNSDYILPDGRYRHMHMLRHLITGQWGETIDTTTAGYFFTKTYTWDLPTTCGTPNPIELVPEELEVIVFIAEDHQEILTGCKAEMVFTNAQPKIKSITANPTQDCEKTAVATVGLYNMWENPITSANILYGIGTDTLSHNWTGSLASTEIAEIQLPTIEIENGVATEIFAVIDSINGEPFHSNTAVVEVTKNIVEANGPLHFILVTDRYATETRFTFSSADGTVLAHGGPWSDRQTNGVDYHRYTFSPAQAGCYILTVTDSYGDGIHSNYGNGFFTVDVNGETIINNDGRFGKEVSYYIQETADGNGTAVGIDEVSAQFNLYPNPTTSVLNIESNQTINQITVFDMAGRQVMNLKGDVKSINTESLSNGIYTIRIIAENGMSTQKFVKE